MSRRTLIAGNWKMYKTPSESREMVQELVALIGEAPEVEVLVCPPFTGLVAVGEVVSGTPLQLGAQNVHWEDQGAFTGEISAGMLLECGCRYVIIGHSERRQYFEESDETINRKLRQVVGTELLPIFCVGESLEQREAGKVQEVIVGQLEQGLAGLSEAQLSSLVLAYEPVWAIGTGQTATPEIAEQVHASIRDWLANHYSGELSDRLRILYGGSVKPENTAELMTQENLDGALVGGASLEAQSFARIVSEAAVAS